MAVRAVLVACLMLMSAAGVRATMGRPVGAWMRRALAIILIAIAFGSIAHAQSLDQQERCAQQAKRAYAESLAEFEAYNGATTQKTVRISGDYQSHYNMKLGKCLMLVETRDMLGSQSTTTAYVVDANERRQYATYVWMSREGKKYWEVPPMACEPTPSLREKRFCKTREEFDEFAAPYMEE
jgi:hypothetical protein